MSSDHSPGQTVGVFRVQGLPLTTTECYSIHMTTKTSHCARCGRALRDPKSIAAGVGPRCAKRIAEAAIVVMATNTATSVGKAIELIGDAGIVRVGAGEFITVSSRGDVRYETTPASCTCTAGVYGRVCYHQVAAKLIAA